MEPLSSNTPQKIQGSAACAPKTAPTAVRGGDSGDLVPLQVAISLRILDKNMA